ncbi:MAG TPA: 7TM diverse intracellular signaling domain-containing protein, partial [Burkholderiaceae bacterium]|nr:7TM diverse intracellular signaling domain-containing protein [Burkholderiaceae bacterium]
LQKGTPTEPQLLYFATLRNGGRVYVNGHLVARIREPDPMHHVDWRRPHGIQIPPQLLVAGDNLIDLGFVTGLGAPALGVARIGPADELRPVFERRTFWMHTMAQTTLIVGFVSALLVLAVWARQGMFFVYGLFGLALLAWSIRTLTMVVPVFPMSIWYPWRIVHIATTGGFIVMMTLFMLRFAGIRRPALERGCLAWCATGPLLYLIGGPARDLTVMRVYGTGLIVIALLMLAATTFAAWRVRSFGAIALCASALLGLGFGVHDYLIGLGLLDPDRPHLMHLAANPLLLSVGILLADRFVRDLRQVEAATGELELQVLERERQLDEKYQRIRGLEAIRVAESERNRIMRGMHDGIGSRLHGALAMLERGALDRDAMARTLREAIDDMRLTIDTLSPGQGIGEALANLVWRLAPRFGAAGIELSYRPFDIDERIELPAESALQLLRIVHEALTNALAHSQATRIVVKGDVGGSPQRLTLSVVVDGCGFDQRSPPAEHGLSTMDRRARRIGAQLSIRSDEHGTRVDVSVALLQQRPEGPPWPDAA